MVAMLTDPAILLPAFVMIAVLATPAIQALQVPNFIELKYQMSYRFSRFGRKRLIYS